jgi:S-DNA-T family DNA segregation ATPase FtsK/SpoIIIE
MAEQRLITATQLRCACVDPEWRARWMRGEDPPTLMFGPAGTVSVQGRLFHQLAFEFTDWLTAAVQGSNAAAAATGEELWALLYDRFAKARLDELISRDQLPSAHLLSRALRAFCVRIAELRQRAGDAFKSWHDVYLTKEFPIEKVRFALKPEGEILVSGRPDAVRMAAANGLEVIDYKLSRGSSLKQDLLQLAIYARLLARVRPGLKFSGALEYYEPDCHVMPVESGELDALFDEVVAPVLRELARPPSRPAAGASSPLQLVRAQVDPETFERVARSIEQCFREFKLPVTVLRAQDAPQLVRYRVLPADGVRVVSLANRAEDLQVRLGLHQAPLIRAAPGCVTIDLPKPQPDAVPWRELTLTSPADSEPLAFPIGVGIEGSLVTADLADPNTCHALVAGASGSGKSEFLKAMLASLITRNSASTLRLTLADPKNVTFSALKDSKHLDGPVLTELPHIIAALEQMVDEMDRRYRRLAQSGFESLTQKGASESMPFRIVVFDEFADLVMQGKREREQFEHLVARLAQKGRAAGIHLVLATQRPDSKVVTGLIKSNLPLRICLRVTSSVNSQIVLDEPGAEALLGRGDLLCLRGRGLERAQSPLITREELSRLV